MINKDNLTDNNFLEYAMESYINFRCHGISELSDDLLKIKYLKKLFRYYNEIGEFDSNRLRLALNHIIIFYNVFKSSAATKILFFKLEKELYPILKTFLVKLNYMPAIVHNINKKDIISKKIPIDKSLMKKLEALK